MEKFVKHEGIVAPLDRVNVDTDQIIPKQFLKRIERTGFGKFAFYDWRYLEDGVPNPDFILNHPKYSKASVLVAGPNFGSGSSREHAPWSCGADAPARPGKPAVSAPWRQHSARRQVRAAAARPSARVLFPVRRGWASVRHGGPAVHSD